MYLIMHNYIHIIYTYIYIHTRITHALRFSPWILDSALGLGRQAATSGAVTQQAMNVGVSLGDAGVKKRKRAGTKAKASKATWTDIRVQREAYEDIRKD